MILKHAFWNQSEYQTSHISEPNKASYILIKVIDLDERKIIRWALSVRMKAIDRVIAF